MAKLEEVKLSFMKKFPFNWKSENISSYFPEIIDPDIKCANVIIYNKSYIFKTLSVNNGQQLEEIELFINNNYGGNPRAFVTKNMLVWLFGINNKSKIIGLYDKLTGFMVGIIGVINVSVIMDNNKINIYYPVLGCIEINYRRKGLFKELIYKLVETVKEEKIISVLFISNDINMESNVEIEYYSRPINIQKVFNNKMFKDIEKKSEEEKKAIIEYFKITRKMDDKYERADKKDIKKIYEIYSTYIKRYNFIVEFTKQELEHLLFNEIVDSFVIKKDNEIVDFCSIYTTWSGKYASRMKNANLFLYTSNDETSYSIIDNLICYCNGNGIDILKCNNLMENKDILDVLKFSNKQMVNVYMGNLTSRTYTPNTVYFSPFNLI